MRINQSRNRRMLIMEQISIREQSREKSRKSSAERRRKVEESLGDFVKTMSDVPYIKTGGSEFFMLDNSLNRTGQNYYNSKISPNKNSQISPKKNQLREQYDGVMRSPSFKDINMLEGKNQTSRENIIGNSNLKNGINDEQKFLRKNKGSKQQKLQQKVQIEGQILDEQIRYNNFHNPAIANNSSNTNKNNQQQKTHFNQQILQNNESSASGIFFTSQFNQFLSKKNQQYAGNQHQDEKIEENNVNGKQEMKLRQRVLGKQQGEGNQEIQNYKMEKHHINEQPRTEMNMLQSEREVQHQQKQKQQHQTNQQPHQLSHNKSNHSLAFSNESSLKYSLNESNIRQIIQQKFTHQLIAHSHIIHDQQKQQHSEPSHIQILHQYDQINPKDNQNDNENDNSSLFLHLKFVILVDNYHLVQYKNTIKEFISLSKLYLFSKRRIIKHKQNLFNAFLIHQQLNLMQKKNQVKADNFYKQQEQKKFIKIFNLLKEQCYQKPQQKLQQALQFHQEKQHQLTQRIFRSFKIAWFDQKVKREIQLYYLSRLFLHFSKTINKQKLTNRKKYLSFYCFNLKKRYFKALRDGVENVQLQRMDRENADCHYGFGLMRKVFDAWRDKLAYKDRYISLAMTTKNTFKETADQRWMQIKTVDFRQIK